MNTYIAFCIQILTFATLLAGSAILLLWLYSKYGKSPQLLIGAIASVWVTLVVNVVLSIFGLRTMLDELIAHPIFTSLLIVTIHISIMAYFINHTTMVTRVVYFCSWCFGMAALQYLCPVQFGAPEYEADESIITFLFMSMGIIIQICAQFFARHINDDDEDPEDFEDPDPSGYDTSAYANSTPNPSSIPNPVFTRRIVWQRHSRTTQAQSEPTPITALTKITEDCLKNIPDAPKQ